jgi:hypothetical protein
MASSSASYINLDPNTLATWLEADKRRHVTKCDYKLRQKRPGNDQVLGIHEKGYEAELIYGAVHEDIAASGEPATSD